MFQHVIVGGSLNEIHVFITILLDRGKHLHIFGMFLVIRNNKMLYVSRYKGKTVVRLSSIIWETKFSNLLADASCTFELCPYFHLFKGENIQSYSLQSFEGGGSQSSGSEVADIDQSMSPLNMSREDILADGTVAERIPYTRYVDWMTNLPKRLHNVPFSRLTIPGKSF